MRNAVVALTLCMLAACAPRTPPAPQLALQPIAYFDVTRNKLYGSGCNFVPSDGGMAAVFLAMADHGVFKLADHIVLLPRAADAQGLPQSAHTHYAGGGYNATLVREPGGKHKELGIVSVFTGHLTITDAAGTKLYEATGDTQCKPM